MNISKVVHCRREPYDVYIGRPSIFGNPFSVKDHGRDEAIRLFELYFKKRMRDVTFKEVALELKGKILGCWCKPKPCHGDVIVECLKSA